MKNNTLSQKLANIQPLKCEQMQTIKGGDDKRPTRPPGGGGLSGGGGGSLPNGAIWALTEKAGLL